MFCFTTLVIKSTWNLHQSLRLVEFIWTIFRFLKQKFWLKVWKDSKWIIQAFSEIFCFTILILKSISNVSWSLGVYEFIWLKIQIFKVKVWNKDFKRPKMDCWDISRNVLLYFFGSKVHLKFSNFLPKHHLAGNAQLDIKTVCWAEESIEEEKQNGWLRCPQKTSTHSTLRPNPHLCEILLNIAKYCGILPNIAEYYGILPNIAEYCQILPNIADYCQILRNSDTRFARILVYYF